MTRGLTRSVILDAEAVSSLTKAHRHVLASLKASIATDAEVMYPTIVLTELLTGNPSDASIWRVVNGIEAVDLTSAIAAQAGYLRERAEKVRHKKRDLTVDAVVAATAVAWAPSVIITSDPEDLKLLTDGHDVRVLPV